ncbi:hypothetical protein [Bradyrhizobium sp. USDA 4545]|uniref:phage tail assembly chaperone n=1 Tax=Bradyrhizobium sp. USDA 4545 TaxID=2817705 RepID=UPI0020A4E5C6|nr:hypothetical protein [Bradyrhizobium sp. USDA 4545]MCP1832837.1 hypothetical protein [Bradyrhizobium sp. USDA 4545]
MSDGATVEDHAKSVSRQLALFGSAIPRMKAKAAAVEEVGPEPPDCPDPLAYLWVWFLKHSLGLSSGGEGFPRVTWEGVEAWARQMRIDLEPWEAELMVELGNLRTGIHNEWRAKQLEAMRTE